MKKLTLIFLLALSVPVIAQTAKIQPGWGTKAVRRDSIFIGLDAARARAMIDSVCQAMKYFEVGYYSYDSTGAAVWNFVRADSALVDTCNLCNTLRLKGYGGTLDSVFARARVVMVADSTDSTTTDVIWRNLYTQYFPQAQTTSATGYLDWKVTSLKNLQYSYFNVPVDTSKFSPHQDVRCTPTSVPTACSSVRYYDSLGRFRPYDWYRPDRNKPCNDSAYWMVPVAIGKVTNHTVIVGGIPVIVTTYNYFPDRKEMFYRKWRDCNTGIITDPNGPYRYDLPGGYIWLWAQMCDSTTTPCPSWDAIFTSNTTSCSGVNVTYGGMEYLPYAVKDTVIDVPCGGIVYQVTVNKVDSMTLNYRTVRIPTPGTTTIDWAATNAQREWVKWVVPAAIVPVVQDTCVCDPAIETENGIYYLCQDPLKIRVEGSAQQPYVLNGTLWIPRSSTAISINGTVGTNFSGLATTVEVVNWVNSQLYQIVSMIPPPLPCSPCDSIPVMQQKIDIANDSIHVGKGRIDHVEAQIECDPCAAIAHHEPRLDSLEAAVACDPCAKITVNEDSLGEHETQIYNIIPGYINTLKASLDTVGQYHFTAFITWADTAKQFRNMSIQTFTGQKTFAGKTTIASAQSLYFGTTWYLSESTSFTVRNTTDSYAYFYLNNTYTMALKSGKVLIGPGGGSIGDSTLQVNGGVHAVGGIFAQGRIGASSSYPDSSLTGTSIHISGGAKIDNIGNGLAFVSSTGVFSTLDTNKILSERFKQLADIMAGKADADSLALAVSRIDALEDSVGVLRSALETAWGQLATDVLVDSLQLSAGGAATLTTDSHYFMVSAVYISCGEPTAPVIVWGCGDGYNFKGDNDAWIRYTLRRKP